MRDEIEPLRSGMIILFISAHRALCHAFEVAKTKNHANVGTLHFYYTLQLFNVLPVYSRIFRRSNNCAVHMGKLLNSSAIRQLRPFR